MRHGRKASSRSNSNFRDGPPSWRADIQVEPTDSEIKKLRDIAEKVKDFIDSEDNEEKKEMLQHLNDAIVEMKGGNFEPIVGWLNECLPKLFEHLAYKALETVVNKVVPLKNCQEIIDVLSAILDILLD